MTFLFYVFGLLGAVAHIECIVSILGGTLAAFAEFPYVVAIYSFNSSTPTEVYPCTGVLLDQTHVLTTKACILKAVTDSLTIIAGTNDPQFNEVTKITFSDLYTGWVTHDEPNGLLSIVLLPTEVVINNFVNFIRVVGSTELDNDADIVGFPTGTAVGEGRLEKLEIPLNNRTFCEANANGGGLCTGTISGKQGICYLGGQLLIERKADTNPLNDVLLGIAKFQCCGHPRCFDTFINIFEHVEWIESITNGT